MNKRQHKMSWLEKLDDLDAKQQSHLDKQRKTARNVLPSKRHSNPQPEDMSSKKVSIFGIIAIILPFLAWLLGAISNPSGWASDDPSIFIFMFTFLSTQFWFVTIPLFIAFLVLIVQKRTVAVATLAFVVSLLSSLFIFNTTATASESEFTG